MKDKDKDLKDESKQIVDNREMQDKKSKFKLGKIIAIIFLLILSVFIISIGFAILQQGQEPIASYKPIIPLTNETEALGQKVGIEFNVKLENLFGAILSIIPE